MTARKRTAASFSQWPEHWACLLPVNLSTSPHSLVLSVLQWARLPERERGVAVSRRRKQHYSTNDRLSRLLLVDQSTCDRLVQAPHPLRLIHKRPSRNSQKYTHTHPFNGPMSRTTQVSRYQKGKTNLDFTEARDSEWQWHQLGHMQVCTSLQTDNNAITPPLSFLQAGCPSCRPTNSVKALKE